MECCGHLDHANFVLFVFVLEIEQLVADLRTLTFCALICVVLTDSQIQQYCYSNVEKYKFAPYR